MKVSQTFSSALIVDDEKDICYLLNKILSQRHIHADLAGSLAEANKLLEKQSHSWIFLDNHLPDGFGLDHIRELKRLNPGIRVIMITAHDNPSERKKAFEQGVDSFINKPFTKEIIYKALE